MKVNLMLVLKLICDLFLKELQFLNKFSLEQTLGSNRPNSFNFNGNVGSSLNNSASNQ